MQKLIDSLASSIKEENWPAALMLALTLQDIAGKIEFSIYSSNKRYADWFNKYVGHRYKSKIGAQQEEHIFLSGNDCYALRCSYLHEGKSSITDQRAREVLEDFEFVVPPKGSIVHCNQSNNKLQLQMDIFCKDILDGLSQWIKGIKTNPVKQTALNNLLKISEIKYLRF